MPCGSFHVTVATIELLIALLEHSIENDSLLTKHLYQAVEFILVAVFASYQEWQRNDMESWDDIGNADRLIQLFFL